MWDVFFKNASRFLEKWEVDEQMILKVEQIQSLVPLMPLKGQSS